MHTQWWHQRSHMCSIVLQYLSFHGYHRNCRFAVQMGRRDSEHQPISCSCLNLTPLCWAQTCCSLAGAGMLGSSKGSRHCWALLGKLGAHTSLPLVWLWVVRFWSRGEDQHFDIQLRGLGEVSSLVVGFVPLPRCKATGKGIFQQVIVELYAERLQGGHKTRQNR